MKSYTLRDLAMYVSGAKYLLPFDVDTKDEEILGKTIALFEEAKIYECELYSHKCKKPPITLNEYNGINLNCLYEGSGEYYDFTINLEVFRFKCEKDAMKIVTYENEEIKDKQWMISIYVETGNELLEELIDIKSMPEIVEKTHLKKYKYA